ncbi:MAG: site-specific integrase [Oscillospiraceae bacterium]|nr:site-specific integrase [Oscillospiraceae bacterium]
MPAKHISVYGKTYREAKDKLEKRKKGCPATASAQAPRTVLQLCEDWVAERETRFKPSTYVKYKNTLQNHIAPTIGGVSAAALRQSDLNEFAALMLTRGRKDGGGGLNVNTARDILKLLSRVWEDAVQQGLAPRMLSFNLIAARARQSVQVLTAFERRQLETYLLKDPDSCKYGILLALYTGLRLGELCALRWADIDLCGGILHVNATMQRIQDLNHETARRTKIICTPPKSPSSLRSIPLPDFLLSLLRAQKPHTKDAYFLTGSADCFVEPRTLENRFKGYLKACQIRDVNFHVLRHTFATGCVEAGFDTKSLSEILGHANVNITMELYVHPTMEYKRSNMNRLAPMGAV